MQILPPVEIFNEVVFLREPAFNFLDWAYGAITKTSFINLDIIPKEGPVILALNHMSRLDFPILAKKGFRNDWTALVADSYKKWPIFKQILYRMDMIWIDRSKADFTAFKKAYAWLKDGKMLALAPEGTRSRTGCLIKAKSGIVLLAAKSGVPICTASITGSENATHELKHFRRPELSMRFGPPYMMNKIDPERRDESLQEETDELMCRIAAMLPEKYRGYYSNFPRVQELTREWQNVPGLELPASE